MVHTTYNLEQQKNGGNNMVVDAFNKTLDRVTEERSPEKIVCIILAVIFAFICAVTAYEATDKTPATFDDYVPLNSRLVAVQDDATKMLEGDGTITIKNGITEYTVENDQCSMTGKYDSDYKLIAKNQKDKSMNFLVANVAVLFMFIIFSVITFFLLMIAVYIILFIAIIIISLVKKCKKAKEQKVSEEAEVIKEAEEENSDESSEVTEGSCEESADGSFEDVDKDAEIQEDVQK